MIIIAKSINIAMIKESLFFNCSPASEFTKTSQTAPTPQKSGKIAKYYM